MSCINVSASRVSGISADASRVGGISVSVALYCDVGSGNYLRVTPVETQWIDIYTSIQYNIKSNTDWIIE